MAGKKKSQSGAKIGAEQFLQRVKPALSEIGSKHSRPINEVLRELKIPSPLVLVSEQHLRMKRLVSWLRETLLSDSPSSFSSYFGSDLSSIHHVDPILTSLVSLSLFSRNEILVIYETEKMRIPPQKSIVDILPRRTDSTLMILCASSINQKCPLLVEAAAQGTVIELVELSGNMLEKWIDKEIQRSGIASGIEGDAKQLLMQCHGGDVARLASEIEKLSLLSVPGEKINRSLVEAISLKTPEVTSFELVRQVAAKNPLRAVALSNDLVAQGLHPLQVNAFLSRAFRVLLANKDVGTSALHADLANPWFLKQLSSSLRHFSRTELKGAINRLTKLDFQLKDSLLPAPLTLSLAIQEIAIRKNPP